MKKIKLYIIKQFDILDCKIELFSIGNKITLTHINYQIFGGYEQLYLLELQHWSQEYDRVNNILKDLKDA